MILYFVRHGQTDFNKEHRLQGDEFDEPLNADGIKEMHDLLPTLPKNFEAIFASPLKRVLMSAEIVGEYSHKPIIIKDELKEYSVGTLAGKTWSEIEGGQELRAKSQKLEFDYRPYGGESVEDVTERLKKFLNDAESAGYASALVVSSRGILRLAHKLIHNEDLAEIENASVYKFEI